MRQPLHFLILAEGFSCHVDGCGYVGALIVDRRWVNGIEKHLRRHVITGHGNQRVGVAGIDDQPHPVVVKTVDELFQNKLGSAHPVDALLIGGG